MRNYNKARYRKFLGRCYIGQTRQEGCTLLGPGNALFQDLSGVPTANAPNWTASAGVSYDTDVGRNLKISGSLDSRYSSRYYASGFGSPLTSRPKYVNLNASLRLARRDDRWELSMIGRNLTNRFIVTGAYDITGTGFGTGTATGRLSDQASSVSLPRTVQFQITFNY